MARLRFDSFRGLTGWLPPLTVLAAAAAFGAPACSASSEGNGFGGSGGGGCTDCQPTTSSGQNVGGGSFTTSGTGTGTGTGGCSEAAKLIYIIGQNNNLYSFHPPTLDLKPIGVIDCPTGGSGATPFSMAVDRQGTAWILFNDGNIFHVDTLTASCSATGYQPGQQGWSTFGMGFVSDTVGSEAETLYVAEYFGAGIGKIDPQELTLSVVAPFDAINTAAELTGTGDSRLYGFFQGSPIIIAEIDKSNGHIISQAPQPTVNIGSGWAFAFWGGDFYLFTSPTGDSQIDRYRPSDGTTTTVLTNIGDNIVGAGVSTCTPTEPPE